MSSGTSHSILKRIGDLTAANVEVSIQENLKEIDDKLKTLDKIKESLMPLSKLISHNCRSIYQVMKNTTKVGG